MTLNDIKSTVKNAIESELRYRDFHALMTNDHETINRFTAKAKTAVIALRSLANVKPFADFSEDIAREIIWEITGDKENN